AAGPVRIVVAVGDASTPDQVAYRASLALAEQLGTPPVTVPGDHDAVTRRPGEFAELLGRVLGGS
ncbi:MAG TPA: alpha/beta hydrolase, partial [Actinomycetota bacterium]|nr:alpha/beta hydrolase [Actinomycetota bacterium]